MTITTRPVDYTHEGVTLEGILATDDEQTTPRPLVLVCHAWAGRGDFEVNIAKQLAGLGYAGFAVDLYGKGVLGTSNEENEKLMTPFVEDRAKLQSRLTKAFETARALPETDPSKTAAIGYCFGGLCVLDFARIGTDIGGVASFHGLFMAPGNTSSKKISAKIIAFHGWDDPMATPDAVMEYTKEMTAAGADWQLHAYGNTLHSFTNPAAQNPDFGTQYSQSADNRSWNACTEFLAEILR